MKKRHIKHVRSQKRASWCSALTRNLQTSKTDILNSSLLNRRGWKQLIFKNLCICKMFCGMLQSTLYYRSVDFVVLTKALLRLCT
jgi:hypothetical protein